MMYRNVVAAVVRALAAETINSAGGCDFEPKVQCAKQKGEIVGKEAAFLTDCWVFGRLHKALSPEHWRALVAKYSTHDERKHAAILELIKVVRSPATQRFRECAVLTWAIPQVAGASGKRSCAVLPAGWYDITNWDNDGKPESTRYRWRSGIRKGLDDQVNEALSAAQELLDQEGLLEVCAA
ncbi:hypothetical protein ACDH60_26090 [Pseudomonas ficuserectae]|uniref:Phage-like protein n=1 Tax=Pseudomonas amygdali pv. lachrymans TaxID=53707 RepID=A0AB37R3S0_PSEAV|nr:hypothetical protein [Pseudomonas amygdali]KKY52743.1 phage-like protein [Pseudomonas amygdali pv. lachrymans]KPB98113.1 Uncharacterized protein AC501_4520 [Pseudomonas amygdali pv. lachrymans]RMU16056.1 hypothetical protein ALP33_01792 [Pseudomonas amygdali pv. lachrymans]WIO56279.1 hypothetical protein QO021_17040 [Pseudomonas amygdali pv. lachrymans]